MFLGDIIKKYRTEHNLSQRDFAKMCNLSHTYIAALEKNLDPRTGKPISPTLDTVKYVSKALNMSIDDVLKILDNEQEFIINDEAPKYKEDSNVFPLPDTPMKVPVVGKIAAGLPILAVENIEGYEYAPSSYIKEGYEYFYLRVQGDSMNLKFNDGDIVLVQKQDFLENDEIGVILVNGFDATVKKYKNNNGIVILEPMSTNPENTVQIYNAKDIEIKIIGKVVSYQGKIN